MPLEVPLLTFQIVKQIAITESPQTQESSTRLQTQASINTNISILATASIAQAPPRKPSMMDNATPTAMVSAFCQAVFSNLIPGDFWGSGDVKLHNERVFYQNVDRFVSLRRFESLSLHEVSQGLKVCLFVGFIS
jgi:telomerase reverse transcriptase